MKVQRYKFTKKSQIKQISSGDASFVFNIAKNNFFLSIL